MQTVKRNASKAYDIILIDGDIDEHLLFHSSFGETSSNKTLFCFDSGQKAIQYLNTLSRPYFPSLIVLDYCIPGMNGKDILLYLKSTYRFSRIPVIVYSSEMDNYIKWDMIELGAVACFKKSEDTEEFRIFLAILTIIFDNKVYEGPHL